MPSSLLRLRAQIIPLVASPVHVHVYGSVMSLEQLSQVKIHGGDQMSDPYRVATLLWARWRLSGRSRLAL